MCVHMQTSTRPQGKGKQFKLHPEQVLLIKELPWVGFEPMTLCSLGERCYPLRTAQHAGAQIYNTIQGKGNVHTYVLIWVV